jgi:hypothetical protein
MLLRVLPVVAICALTSLASAQIVFHPPVRVEEQIYPPPQAMAIARSIHWPDCIVIIQSPDGQTLRVISGSRWEMDQPLLREGVDPATNQPLYFRKRDLLTQPGDGTVERIQPRANPAPANQPDAEKGRILIKPYRPNRAGSLASR